MFGSEKNNADEIGRLWQRLVPLEEFMGQQRKLIDSQEKEISSLKEKIKQPTESQEEALHSARSAAQHKGKVKKAKEEAEAFANEANQILTKLNALFDTTTLTANKFDVKVNSYEDTFEKGETLFANIKSTHDQLEERISETNNLLSKNDDLAERLDDAASRLEVIKEIDSKTQGILKNITSNHSRVRELRDEILGYDTENDEGESEHIEGIKDKLASTYSTLKVNITDLEDNLQQLSSKSETNFQSLLDTSKVQIEEQLKSQEKQYGEVYQRIITLLPAALTAGLSAAYNEKISSESLELEIHNKTFSKSIKWLIGVSFIPFLIDLYLLVIIGQDLVEVISETPKLVLSILPLYFPILWMAYSSNKKMNLSKRLIEEYTHKGVLSKTFEGLSTQIEDLGVSETSNELKVKLLFNLLHVNSENPGKLISDYKTTDHPLMDALDKSVKLGDAVDKLRNIPGFTKLTAKLERESREVLKDTEDKASKALTALNTDENQTTDKQIT